jgi:cold shock CspA family protein
MIAKSRAKANGVSDMEGKLKTWNTDRGFGFISPTGGGADVFVHIKALPRDGSRPIVGEVLQFDVDTDRDGRKRAVNVRRPGQKARAMPTPRSTTSNRRSSRSLLGSALSVVMLVAIASYAYERYQAYSGAAIPEERASSRGEGLLTEPSAASSAFKCDGRTLCSQMRSCDEAMYFLKNCPGVKMDGNNDGEPCEQQWCN